MRAFSLRKRGLCDLARGRGKAWPLSPPYQPAPAALRPSVLQAGTQQKGHSVLGGLCLPPFPSPGLSRWPTCHRPWSLRSLGAQPEAGGSGVHPPRREVVSTRLQVLALPHRAFVLGCPLHLPLASQPQPRPFREVPRRLHPQMPPRSVL